MLSFTFVLKPVKAIREQCGASSREHLFFFLHSETFCRVMNICNI